MFPFFKQLDKMDCGPTCLKMISKHYKRNISLQVLRDKAQIGKDGVNLLGISAAAESVGFRCRGVEISFDELIKHAPKPAILHWRQNHFVVLTPKSKHRKVVIADPAQGVITYTENEFLQNWLVTKSDRENLGIALLLEPTPHFFEQQDEKADKIAWGILFSYLAREKGLVLQLFVGLVVGSLLQLLFPFLAQSIVDIGISTHNMQFIYMILLGQFMLFLGRTMVEFIRSRILLNISTKINVSILSDFWIKLMKLPLSYFDAKLTGDILQRIADQRRIESFLTGTALNTFFSFFNLFLFSFVLLSYNFYVFLIFVFGSALYFFWIRIFLKFRKKLDYKRFSRSSNENSATMQLIYGMQDIKLNNAEYLKRWEWESLQVSLFKLSFRSLSLSQYQQAGAFFLNEGKNIFITFFVAQSVINGQLTLGAMLAIQYIIGQLNSPVEQLVGFSQQAQDARISLDRLNEIHQIEDEEPVGKQFLTTLPRVKSISISNLSFTYIGAGNEAVLRNISLHIPEGKITAIVGMSGSGKTTLLKILMRFYENYTGDIRIGATYLIDSQKEKLQPLLGDNGLGIVEQGVKFGAISPRFWRSQCGAVMQDGFIFSDTIAKNIAVGDRSPDYERLLHACTIANILSFIETLPLGFNTKIGAEGNGISQGQKQRILVARVIYKDPEYIFFDEATNSLDANNEKLILENLDLYFRAKLERGKSKTVVIVAHRMSTVKNADSIIMLQNGLIVEHGNHKELTKKKGYYYELVKNQLELDA